MDSGNKINLGKYLESNGVELPNRKRVTSLWKGPEEDGITFSLLSRFLVCRERFRLYVCEGLTTSEGWNHKIGYGNLWHECEEVWANPTSRDNWMAHLQLKVRILCRQYPMDQQKILHWYNVCLIQFPIYIFYWGTQQPQSDKINEQEATKVTPLLQEQVFNVPYKLPSGRAVILRGKWDSIDLVTVGNKSVVWLQENKTKGDIKPQQLQRQLRMDLQTMIYLTALQMAKENTLLGNTKDPIPDEWVTYPIAGVRYNVIRRPLSGGKGTIIRHKGTKNKKQETLQHFYSRVAEIIEKEPEHYFMRWNVEVSPKNIEDFKVKCLNPILEQLCDWWNYIKANLASSVGKSVYDNPYVGGKAQSFHWQHPFGVWNPLDEGGASDLDGYLEDGSEIGLARTNNLFPELTGE